MGTLSRVAEPFWTREFVAKQLWLLIGVVTFGLVLFAAALDFDALAPLQDVEVADHLTGAQRPVNVREVREHGVAQTGCTHLTGPHRTCKEGPAARDGR